jgi:hypothetical protein
MKGLTCNKYIFKKFELIKGLLGRSQYDDFTIEAPYIVSLQSIESSNFIQLSDSKIVPTSY